MVRVGQSFFAAPTHRALGLGEVRCTEESYAYG